VKQQEQKSNNKYKIKNKKVEEKVIIEIKQIDLPDL
jgi:hypothetical protein